MIKPGLEGIRRPASAWSFRVAPAVRAPSAKNLALRGTPVTGKMASALHELGFDDVFRYAVLRGFNDY